MFETLESRRLMSVVLVSAKVITPTYGLIAKVTPGSTVTLNPQPLPPGEASSFTPPNPGGPVSLNPQPLPPGGFSATLIAF